MRAIPQKERPGVELNTNNVIKLKRKRIKKINPLWIIAGLLAAILIAVLVILVRGGAEGIAETGSVTVDVDYNAVIVRKEKVTTSEAFDLADYFAEEGAWVEPDTKIMQIYRRGYSEEQAAALMRKHAEIYDEQLALLGETRDKTIRGYNESIALLEENIAEELMAGNSAEVRRQEAELLDALASRTDYLRENLQETETLRALYSQADALAEVPPDYFSPTGQLWGNPLYNWEIHASENYAWWAERLQCAQKLYDVVRIDHFRGFESFWAVPFGETTAENGRWLPAPGMDFVNAVKKRLPGLSFIAEDLGFLTPEVHELVKNSGFPGMSILQFGFNPDANSDYLPHRVAENRVYYTGTHDNAPIMQWFAEASESERRFAEQYLALNAAEGINWGMIRGGMCSPAGIFIAQMQDVLGLSAEGRINTPGVASGNWQWRMLPHECSAALAEKLREYTRMYGRLHDCGEVNF